MRFRREAQAFVLWREGVSAGWDCTRRELAKAAGLSYATTRRIIQERGWPVASDNERSPAPRSVDVVADLHATTRWPR